MTKEEKIIVSAYTGCLMCDFQDVHKYIEGLFHRPVYSHEFLLDYVQEEIKRRVRPDFIRLCETED